MLNIYIQEFEKYGEDLAKGRHGPWTKLDEGNAFHNRIVDKLRKQGCGVNQIEEEVHAIRLAIQTYFDSFNPHRRWWNRKGSKLRKVNVIP